MTMVPTLRRLFRSGDWAWGGAGLTLATASASFAGYMIATAPAEVTGFGSKDFGLFAAMQRNGRTAAPAATRAVPRPAPSVVANAAPTRPTGPEIDFAPTGSITAVSRSTGPLGDFHLRDVFGDHALIEHQSTLSLVKPGSTLAGAGEVLAIERQGRGWVVRTASGTIGGL